MTEPKLPRFGRVVFDTNVLISAAFFKGSKPDKAFEKAVREYDIITSTAVTNELINVIHRAKFDKYLKLKDRLAFVAKYIEETQLITVKQKIKICRDPKDDKYLELAVTGQAGCIVSGDEDLLVLHPFRGIPIMTPSDFLKIF